MADDPQPGQNDLSDKVFKVEVVSAPRSAWSIAVDRIKELSVVFTAGFAALNFMMPQSVKDDVAIWWAALDAPRADLVEPVVLEAPVIEGGDDSGPTGWVYAGNGSASDTSPAWIFGIPGKDIAVGATLKPITDVNVRAGRVTGVNPSPDITDILWADGERCIQVREVDPSKRTPSVWVFGEIVACSKE